MLLLFVSFETSEVVEFLIVLMSIEVGVDEIEEWRLGGKYEEIDERRG